MLGFIAGLDERRLRTARDQHGTITAAVLYGELLEQWLDHEYTRAQPRGAAPTLSHGQRWSAVTKLALRLWESTEPTLAARTSRRSPRRCRTWPSGSWTYQGRRT